MKIKFLFFLSALILISFPGKATHIVGGEITYKYLGNDNYQFTLIAYRDCFNGIPPFDNPAAVGIYDSANVLIIAKDVTLTSQSNTTNSPYNCVSGNPASICYETGMYVFTVNLPKKPGGYQIAYQRCCRTSAITNIVTPTSTGITLYATIPDSANAENSSPVFTNASFTFLCINHPFTFDNSAIDSDGDSLVYTINTPLHGESDTIPNPSPPNNPPYPEISWLPPYTLSNVFGGSPLSIDSQTGLLSCNPNTPGIFTYGVSVKEYRNGIYLGETRRDFQVHLLSISDVEDVMSENLIKYSSTKKTFTFNSNLIFENGRLTIYDDLGKEIMVINDISCNTISLDENALSSQLYFYRFTNDGKIIGSGKFLY